ncbi:MAG: hypothetical protein SWK90_12550 [Chloroflexota bacterium]|nr:hypothetical protein [Chloroflexota bacterium]
MSNKKPGQREQLLHVWLPAVVLKFLVFLAFAFVLFEVTVGLGERNLSGGQVGVIVAGMGGLLLLLAVDRLYAVKFTPSGVEATLSEVKARVLEEVIALEDPEVAEVAQEQINQAEDPGQLGTAWAAAEAKVRALQEVGALQPQIQSLEEVGALEDREVAEAARARILQAESPAQVEAARAIAVELNFSRVMERVKEGIRGQRKCYVHYRPDLTGPVDTYLIAPLDVKPGKTPTTRANDYVWAYSYDHESVVSLRLGRVMGIELSEENFDPAELMADWKKKPEWNVAREW